MPRHRNERVPRHRAPRPRGNPVRRARLTAAVAAAPPGLAATAPSDADAARTEPLPLRSTVPRRRPDSQRAPASDAGRRAVSGRRRPLTSHPTGSGGALGGAARGLLVSPWFAAAAGFVIAGSLWIYSPHTELTFPDLAIGTSRCSDATCDGPTTEAHGSGSKLATPAPGRTTKSRQNSGKTAGAGTAPVRTEVRRAHVSVGYHVTIQNDHRFSLSVTVSGKHIPQRWRLAFTIPGVQVQGAVFANWTASTSDSGTARPTYEAGWPGSGGRQNGDSSHGLSGAGLGGQRGRFEFVIFGTGTPGQPTGCTYDGDACTFHEISTSRG